MSGELRPPASIGFVGLGNMGRPMAARIAAAGYPLRLFDQNRDAASSFASEHGGTVASSLKELAQETIGIVTMLPDGTAVSDVVLRPGGLAAGLAAGATVIDMSSSDPIGTRALGAALGKRGIAFIDAPVSGGTRRARDGSLSAMIGGAPEAVEKAMPLLSTMAASIFVAGGLGAGHAMKALNNMVSAAGLWIACEALGVGRSFGLEPETMVDILNASTGRNNSTEHKLKQQILSRSFASGFSVGLMAKDLATAERLADATNVASPLFRRCAELWRRAAEELGGSEDHTAIAKVLEKAQDVENAQDNKAQDIKVRDNDA